MSSATNDRPRRACRLLLAAVALMLLAGGRLPAQPAAGPDNETGRITGPAAVPADAPTTPDDPKLLQRRHVMRRVAWASLLIILLLIIAVVVVMIMSRRMRIRYLGWDRRITFSRLWDVWWQKTGDQPDEKDRPAKK